MAVMIPTERLGGNVCLEANRNERADRLQNDRPMSKEDSLGYDQ